MATMDGRRDGRPGGRRDGDLDGRLLFDRDAALADGEAVLADLRQWAAEAGFSQIGVAGVDLSDAEPGLLAWLDQGFHGSMAYLARHGLTRARPAELVPGTVRVITARMDYLPALARAADSAMAGADRGMGMGMETHTGANANASTGTTATALLDAAATRAVRAPAVNPTTPHDDWRALEWQRLADPAQATVSIYARGRDYHKVLRGRLQALADRLAARVGPLGHRVFTDSAPVLEVELASRSGLGWRGKHTLALAREAGSMFFLGEIFIDLPLPLTPATSNHCGSCSACIDVCPTRAIVGPYRLDARRCISYLTIEHAGPIPLELRPLIGNRIYGCDDCQLICPWNKFAHRSGLADFDVRPAVGAATLLQLWPWTEADFLRLTEGSAIRRIGWARWQRNLAVASGNALRAGEQPGLRQAIVAARALCSDELVREHIDWALAALPVEAAALGSGSPLPLR